MKYFKNIETGSIGKFAVHQGDEWEEITKSQYDDYNEPIELENLKVRKKEEFRRNYIDSQIQSQLYEVENATTEQELNNIN